MLFRIYTFAVVHMDARAPFGKELPHPLNVKNSRLHRPLENLLDIINNSNGNADSPVYGGSHRYERVN